MNILIILVSLYVFPVFHNLYYISFAYYHKRGIKRNKILEGDELKSAYIITFWPIFNLYMSILLYSTYGFPIENKNEKKIEKPLKNIFKPRK